MLYSRLKIFVSLFRFCYCMYCTIFLTNCISLICSHAVHYRVILCLTGLHLEFCPRNKSCCTSSIEEQMLKKSTAEFKILYVEKVGLVQSSLSGMAANFDSNYFVWLFFKLELFYNVHLFNL